jgi:hypothetical protein
MKSDKMVLDYFINTLGITYEIYTSKILIQCLRTIRKYP